jgi:GNAT superfamily N-acetyltransferase
LSVVRQVLFDKALTLLTEKGFKITFSRNSREIDEVNSSSIESRVEDLHEAFLDKNVKAILTCIGGFNVNQILEYIDYSLIEANPKIICGFSDITALLNAIYSKTGLVTYHGPHFSSFGFEKKETDYTYSYFERCLMNSDSFGFIAKEINKIIGFAYCYTLLRPDGKTMFYLHSIGMLPNYQDKGYGSKLLSFIKEYSKEIGCSEMFLITDKGNPRACHVYEKLGGKNDYKDEIVYVYDYEKGDK